MIDLNLFFGLIRTALWGERINGVQCSELSHQTFNELSDVAKQQTVMGLIIRGLIDNDIKLGKLDAISLVSFENKLKKNNTLVCKLLADFNRMMVDKYGYVVVKGQTLAALYPEGVYRTPGDIDVYVKHDDFTHVCSYIEHQWNLKINDDGISKDVNFTKDGVLFEVHRTLEIFCSGKSQKYWDALFADSISGDHIFIDGECINVLDSTMNVLYVFVHLYMHQLVLGIGMRQLCDLAIVLHNNKDKVNHAVLKKHLLGLDFYNAFCAVGSILVDKIGLPVDDFPFEITERHRVYGLKMVGDIFKRGNFGFYNRKHNTAGWLHSIETGWISINHCLRYYWLSPREVRMFLPKQVIRSVRVNLS